MKPHHKRTLKITLLVLVSLAAFSSHLTSLRTIYKNTFRNGSVLEASNQLSKEYDGIAEAVSKRKMDHGAAHSLYLLQHGYLPPTEIAIPEYFRATEKNVQEKPLIQDYDPRFTLSIYYNWIRLNPGKPVPFHWSDWLDSEFLKSYVNLSDKFENVCKQLFLVSPKLRSKKTRPVDSYCKYSAESVLGFKITNFPGVQTHENVIKLGKSYLYSEFPAPYRLVFMTNSRGAYIVDVEKHENDLQSSLLHNKMPEDVLATQNLLKLDVLKSYKSLLKTRRPQIGPSAEPDTIDLEEEWFEMDINKTMQDLRDVPLSNHEQRYFESLEYSSATKSPKKSLHEASILPHEAQHNLGLHYDWRFFDGINRGSDIQRASLHRMVRAYLKFCRTNHLVSWIAHGSLLSWYWNGLAFPWDLDIDAQMPLGDLHKLARNFNQTLVLENAGNDLPGKNTDMDFNGMGAYFIDVGAGITHRGLQDRFNKIDARFIDIHTGLYVDITGLSITGAKPPSFYGLPRQMNTSDSQQQKKNKEAKLFNCKNSMWASHKELSPLKKALIDNEIGYVPSDFGSVLRNEYKAKSLSAPSFSGYDFVKNLRLWVKNQVVLEYFNKPNLKKSTINKSLALKIEAGKAKTEGILSDGDAVKLLYDENLFRDYVRSLRFTKFHESQMEHLMESRQKEYFLEIENYENGGHLGKALWEDSFMTKIALKEWIRDQYIKKID